VKRDCHCHSLQNTSQSEIASALGFGLVRSHTENGAHHGAGGARPAVPDQVSSEFSRLWSGWLSLAYLTCLRCSGHIHSVIYAAQRAVCAPMREHAGHANSCTVRPRREFIGDAMNL